MNINLTKLVQESHALSREKGWYETARSDQEFLQLMVSEIAEATEHVRKGNDSIFQMRPVSGVKGEDTGVWVSIVRGDDRWNDQCKPDGEVIEFADCAIRIADYFGYKRWDLDKLVQAELRMLDGSPSMSAFRSHTPLEQHFGVVRTICKADGSQGSSYLALAMIQLDCLARLRGHDLVEAIAMKHEYNRTRSHRHGGKKL